MKKLYPSAAAALDGVIANDMLIAAGGFGLCGIPSVLIAALHEQDVVLTAMDSVLVEMKESNGDRP